MKKAIFCIGFILFFSRLISQNVGISDVSITPDPSAILEVRATNKGILIPRVSLTSTTSASPITSPAISLIVYNTATVNDVTPGFYYWNGTQWVRFATGNIPAGITMNCGTNNYLLKRESATSVSCSQILDNGSNIMVGISSTYNKFHVEGNVGSNYAIGFFRNNQLSDGYAVFGVSNPTDFWGIGGYFEGGWRGLEVRVTPTGSHTYTGIRLEVNGGSGTNYGIYSTIGGSGQWKYGLLSQINQSTPTINTYGVYSTNQTTTGTLATINSAGTQIGVMGAVQMNNGVGLYGQNNDAAGTGLAALGNNSPSWWYLTTGSGSAFTGYQSSDSHTGIGVYGKGINTQLNGTAAGGYFEGEIQGSGTSYAYVGYRSGGTNYKINGTGSVSTIVRDTENKLVNMFCPETPEVLFMDFGIAQLNNGRAYVQLDPTFAKNIVVDEKHPLRVFVQIYDDEECKGVIVRNRSRNGFEVVERDNGTSNAIFGWYVIANRVDEYSDDGKLISKYQDLRFPPAPKPQQSAQQPSTKLVHPAIDDNKRKQ